jgi:hypothetical protein
MNHTFQSSFLCPVCQRQVKLDDKGKIISHEVSKCTGSHVEWKNCEVDVNKPHHDLALAKQMTSMIDFMTGIIAMAKAISHSQPSKPKGN